MKALWDSYAALATHLNTTKNMTKESKEKAKYQSLFNVIKSKEFVINLGMMHDPLTELSDLSSQMQKKSMTLPEADNAIRRAECLSPCVVYQENSLRKQLRLLNA